MPLVDGAPGSDVFWNTTDILNFARVLVNDCQQSLAGQDLADSRPYTWTLLNLCYAKLANWLEDNNVESASYNEATISLPPSGVYSDPNAQSRLGYDGFQDAAGNTYETPTLPPDLLEPKNLWQTPTGLNVPDISMKQSLGGLEGAYYQGINGGAYGGFCGTWEFRQNSIYFLGGAYQPTDIRIRYIPSLPVLVQPTADQPAPPTIWFARAGEALAYLVAAEFQEIRNAANAPVMRAKANEQLQIIANKSAKRANQAQTRRKGYGFNRRRGCGFWGVPG